MGSLDHQVWGNLHVFLRISETPAGLEPINFQADYIVSNRNWCHKYSEEALFIFKTLERQNEDGKKIQRQTQDRKVCNDYGKDRNVG